MSSVKLLAESAFSYHAKKAALLNAKKRRERELSRFKFKQMMLRAEKDLELVKPWFSKIQSSSKNFKITFQESGEREFQLKLLLGLLCAGQKDSHSKSAAVGREKVLVGLYAAVSASAQFEALSRVLGVSGKNGLKFLDSADDFRGLRDRKKGDFYGLVERSKATEIDEELKLELAPLYDKLAAVEVKLSQLVELSEMHSVAVLKDPKFASDLRIGIFTGVIDAFLAIATIGIAIAGFAEMAGFALIARVSGVSFSLFDLFLSVWDTHSKLKDLSEYQLTGDSIQDYSSADSFGSWVNYYKDARFYYGLAKAGWSIKNKFLNPSSSKSLTSFEKFKWGYDSASISWETYNNFSFQVLDRSHDGQDSSPKAIVNHLLSVAKHAEEVL